MRRPLSMSSLVSLVRRTARTPMVTALRVTRGPLSRVPRTSSTWRMETRERKAMPRLRWWLRVLRRLGAGTGKTLERRRLRRPPPLSWGALLLQAAVDMRGCGLTSTLRRAVSFSPRLMRVGAGAGAAVICGAASIAPPEAVGAGPAPRHRDEASGDAAPAAVGVTWPMTLALSALCSTQPRGPLPCGEPGAPPNSASAMAMSCMRTFSTDRRGFRADSSLARAPRPERLGLAGMSSSWVGTTRMLRRTLRL
mmetsp:Transcript_9666/g.28280  ORF Transcript_9666/g.28280 Transcript_9666/m.28280 type:complete len:252 (+) Transcript_9666:1046-1801(+)